MLEIPIKKRNSPVYGERHPSNLFEDKLAKKPSRRLPKRDKELQLRYNKLKEK